MIKFDKTYALFECLSEISYDNRMWYDVIIVKDSQGMSGHLPGPLSCKWGWAKCSTHRCSCRSLARAPGYGAFHNSQSVWYTSCNKAKQRSDIVCCALPLISFSLHSSVRWSRRTVPPKLSKPLEISFQGPSWKLFDPPKAGISMGQLTTYNILIHLIPYNLYNVYNLYNL